MPVNYFELTEKQISRDLLLEKFSDPACGAFVSFEGWVRNHHDNRPVSHLFYEAYAKLAINEASKILEQALVSYGIISVICIHRLGSLQVGDMAVWVGVNAAHRDAAFEACRFVIDEIKLRVPIWKKEYYLDSTKPLWVGSEVAG
jgi:molybdopterin synthase catalytic subunit